MNLLSVLRDSLYFFRINLLAIVRLCLPLVVVETVVTQWVGQVGGDERAVYYDVLVGLLFYPLYTGALILFLDARSDGYSPSGRDLLATALRLWPSFALLAGMSTLLIMLGMSLFLLPGLWVMVKLAFAEYLLVLHQLTPMAAMRQSFEMTRGHFWLIMGCVLAVLVPLWLLDGLVAQLLPAPQPLWASLLLGSLSGFLQLFVSVVLFRLFMLVNESARPRP
ncbi:YciC family protein [Pseudomonas sp. nanlin1]|uniref:YciC family protein n=1 Tax=Pseudomonas sp. nanlin1 TaxID=3040605 RepID=UPI00388E26D2